MINSNAHVRPLGVEPLGPTNKPTSWAYRLESPQAIAHVHIYANGSRPINRNDLETTVILSLAEENIAVEVERTE